MSDTDGMAEALNESGIAVPPLGAFRLADVRIQRSWAWGTDDFVPREHYMFRVDPVAHRFAAGDRLFALSHNGHGANSYGLTLVTSAGPVAAFIQHHYGGAYSNPLRALTAINSTYSKLHVLFGGLSEIQFEQPRWMLVHSDFRGVTGILDLRQMSGMASTTEWLGDPQRSMLQPPFFAPFADESSAFRALVERLNLRDSGFGLSRVEW